MSEVILKQRTAKIYALNKRKIPVLSGVNLQVNRGEFIAIMWSSGSGKTTLLNVLGCLDKPTSVHWGVPCPAYTTYIRGIC